MGFKYSTMLIRRLKYIVIIYVYWIFVTPTVMMHITVGIIIGCLHNKKKITSWLTL